MRVPITSVIGLTLLSIAFAGTASSAQKMDAATEQRIKALEARVESLERRDAARGPEMQAPVAPTAATPSQSAAAPMMAPAPMVAAPIATTAAPQQPMPAVVRDWSALHRGMTQRQVTEVLGAPGDKRVRPLSETWYYPDTDGRSVEFNRDGRVESWSNP